MADTTEDALRRLEERLQRAAPEQLHHEIVAAVLGDVEVEDLEDVVVADDVDGARLVVEAVDDAAILRELRMEELDGDAAADPGVHRQVDRAHPALPQEPLHPIAAHDAPDQLVFRRQIDEAVPVFGAMADLVAVAGLAVGAGAHAFEFESAGRAGVKQRRPIALG